MATKDVRLVERLRDAADYNANCSYAEDVCANIGLLREAASRLERLLIDRLRQRHRLAKARLPA